MSCLGHMLEEKAARSQRVLAIIPARKGSKRIPRKNVRLLGGKPLICWTFEAAKKASSLHRVVVSTDDEEVKKLAEEYEVEVPFFPRPPEISEDVDTVLVLQHCIKFLEEKQNYHANYIVTLQPTSPFRTAEDIDGAVKAIKYFRDANNMPYDTVITVTEATQHPEWMFKSCPRHRGRIVPFLNVELTGEKLVSQNLPVLMYPTGAAYVNTRELIVKYRRMFGWNIYGFHVPQVRSIDIEEIE